MIILKSLEEIKRISEPCRIVAEVLEKVKKTLAAGITTKELDSVAEAFIRSKNATPAFKGYKGYPATLCTSLNDQVVHGIPGKTVLKDGDIVSIDVGVYLNGFYGDAAITLPVGQVSATAEKLMKATEESLFMGIEKAVDGNRLYDISAAVQEHVESRDFSVVRNFVGHGIGRELHEDPQIPNFGKAGDGPPLREGMTLAIEPMVNAGSWKVNVLEDGWTAVTGDSSLSAHFEHTVAITENGPIILTKL